ncbi:hypothetical protein D3C75_1053740 [compost metagenome]
MLLGQARQGCLETRQRVPAAGNLQDQCTALAVAGQARGHDRAAIVVAGPAQDVGQFHGIGAQSTDDKELFANGGGGHAAFLKR